MLVELDDKGVFAHPSTVGRSVLQGGPKAIGEVATPCCMHASRFSISTHHKITH